MAPTRKPKLLNASLSAGTNGWNEVTLKSVSNVIMSEEDFSRSENATLYLESLLAYADGIKKDTERKYRNRASRHQRPVDVFECLFDKLCNKLALHTKEEMRNSSDDTEKDLSEEEFRLFIGHLLVKQTIKLSADESWDILSTIH
jgi:hypothetical protein